MPEHQAWTPVLELPLVSNGLGASPIPTQGLSFLICQMDVTTELGALQSCPLRWQGSYFSACCSSPRDNT